ncbi:MaoC/PaaZ C-terminal domain-containing protein [Kerstersia sp.]|uniref:MaoC/PaaZ C-terminal domain-containing protein n=1 Tax=Kerstersia sp. TaxID=1930783 RepID=UPI003F927BFF
MLPTTDPAALVSHSSLSQQDFDRFAALSGDHNPIHVDPVFSASTPFGATVSHGMLLFSRLRGLVERHYPGLPLASQTLMFPAPCYADEPLKLVLTPEPAPAGQGIALRTEIIKQDGRHGLRGHCVLHAAADAQAAAHPPAHSATHASRAAHPAANTAAPAPLAPGSAGAAALVPSMARFLALRAGDSATLERCYTQDDYAVWAALADSPAVPAALPEPLIPALFSCLLGEELPGHGTNYLKQSLHFLAPAQPAEPLRASVTVSRLRADKALVNLQTRCTGADGRLLCHGEALVLFRQ